MFREYLSEEEMKQQPKIKAQPAQRTGKNVSSGGVGGSTNHYKTLIAAGNAADNNPGENLSKLTPEQIVAKLSA